jgi:hypothetical protein
MNDQAMTSREAAAWLRCSESKINNDLQAGRLCRFGSAPSEDKVLISLNSVVILGESLPAEHGVFTIQHTPAELDRAASSTRAGVSATPESRWGNRAKRPVIVERRPIRSLAR